MISREHTITIIGELMLETWGSVTNHPEVDSSSEVRDLQHFLGGMALNSAMALANLGFKPKLLTYFGPNVPDNLLEDVATKGVSLANSVAVPFLSPETFMFSTSEGYHHYLFTGNEPTRLNSFTSVLPHSDVILLTGSHLQCFRNFYTSLVALEYRRKLIFSPSYALNKYSSESLQALIRGCSILILNRRETEWLCSWLDVPKQDLPLLGPDLFVNTLDKDGCALYTKAESHVVNAIPTSVNNPIGAGDAFNAGFIAALLNERPLTTCIEFGVTVASLVVSSATNYSKFDLNEVEDLWMMHFHSSI